MPRVCTICTNKKRKEIDAAIVARKSLRYISVRYKVGVMSLQRHQEHIKQAVARVQAVAENRNGNSVWYKLEKMVDQAEKEFKASKGMLRATWFREIRATIETGIKLGLEAHREKREFLDCTPAVLKMIEEAKK